MSAMRAMLLRHPARAMILVLAALCMKLIVPSGYMIGADAKVFTVKVCEEATGNQIVKQIAVPMKDGGSDAGHKQGKAECPFASLSMASLGGADPALLALALAFILALGFAPARIPVPQRTAHLRPPLRGPPALV
ncbi:hypothetical protein H7F50_10875 [Novosphingobium flavum]|uniref:DUF2946 family protein n=1 Tax=Novosphingobium aerophilum TaxID=2839843 RepID=UPI00163A9203|nr:DUF2946 family protein [Novosphingobium aerophilum]MBC2662261.1 hypothetical protein [Novosphingobium aerophilum]